VPVRPRRYASWPRCSSQTPAGRPRGYGVLRDAHQVRQLIGLTGQYASVDEGLSGTNNLLMIGRLLGLPRLARARAAGLLARFDLTQAAARPAKTYSGGMRRRLGQAASLVGDPRVLQRHRRSGPQVR
jgi:oleandomycin transport system ATP-binding protein